MTLPGIWPLRRVRVTGPSMVPALRDGDQVVVRMGAGARPGDVVVVDLPERPLSVKRLVRRRPDGTVWVEGDNAFGSTDSRDLGALPAGAVVARALVRLWPRPGYVPVTPRPRQE